MKRLLPGIVAMLLAASVQAGEPGLVTRPSPHSVAKTIDRLEQVVTSKGMTVFARIDHAEAARKAGLSMPPAVVLLFGNPKGGTPLMKASPTVAIDLPIKALVWEDAKGKVWLSYNTAAYLKERHGLRGVDELLGKLEKGLEAMMNQALR
ncbi:MAG: DUF302 domain-containing protein [Deltaproteobacteria bacterium]